MKDLGFNSTNNLFSKCPWTVTVSANMFTGGKVLKAPLVFCQEQIILRKEILCIGLIAFPCEWFEYFLFYCLLSLCLLCYSCFECVETEIGSYVGLGSLDIIKVKKCVKLCRLNYHGPKVCWLYTKTEP